jgi:hypothetical protein
MPADVEMVTADVMDPTQAANAATGASVVSQALNSPSHLWHEFFPGLPAAAPAAAQSVNATYVSIENLHMYDSSKPMTEVSPVAPVSRKGALRQKMAEEVMAAHTRGDVRATAAVGTHDRAFGQAWIAPHAPAITRGHMVDEACRVLGVEPSVSAVSPRLMRLVGLFLPGARASVEMMYEFTAPLVVDSSRIEREFSLSATPIPAAIERTIAWYRDHLSKG